MRPLPATLLLALLGAPLLLGKGTPSPTPAAQAGQAEQTVHATTPGEGGAWTNLVGAVLIAEPLALLPDRGAIRFRLARGGTREVPLAAFPESERTRLAIALGSPPIPPSLSETWDFALEASRRAQALLAAGRTTPEACERRRAALRTLLREAILALPDLTPSHRQALLRKSQTL